MNNTFEFAAFGILQTLLFFYLVVAVARALLQYSDADFYNPVSRIVDQVTKFPISFLRLFTPRIGGSDKLSPILLILIIACVEQLLIQNLRVPIFDIFVLGLARSIRVIGDFLVYTILAAVVLSWIGPRKPFVLTTLIYSISLLVLAPIRRFLPPVGGLDFSPIVAMIALSIITGTVSNSLIQFIA